MKTDQLIAALAADAERGGLRTRHGLWLAVLAGSAGTLVLFMLIFGIRDEIASALLTWRFDVKMALAAIAVVAGLIDCLRTLQPTKHRAFHWSTGVLCTALLAAVLAELMASPRANWGDLLIGTNAMVCLIAVPALALAPLVTVLWAMRAGAPASPALAGASAGRLAAAIGAALYATYCPDDSPLFVAVWYSAAILLVAGAGALIGARLLRW